MLESQKQEEHTCIHGYGYLKVRDGEVAFEKGEGKSYC